MARARLNKLDAQAYAEVFRAVFAQVKADHPEFTVGESLKGIVLDWSHAQQKGLEGAIGKGVAKSVVKGCQVCVWVYIFHKL